jgi:tryptophanyl-tRNA synthetase
MTERKIVFSGIQPTGNLHIGNYLGAIKRWVAMQDEYDCIYCIVDMHAITIPQDPQALREQTRELAGLLMACGIDPERCVLFVQSHVPAHAELTWIFNCITPVGWLERMTQYKEKAARQESVSTGLLDYPVLQASDILLYQTDLVPVGEDQRQHIELTRDIAGRFNYLFGETFKLPEAMISEVGARIMGLDDPTKKMSKSIETRYHAIRLLDDPDEIRRAIRRAVTDSGREIIFSDDPAKAGINNLLTIYQAFTGQSRQEIEDHFAGKGYGELKAEVAEVVVEALRPIQERYRALRAERGYIDEVLRRGAEEAKRRSEPTLTQAKHRVGFILPEELQHHV